MTNITAVRVTNSFTLKEVKVMHHTRSMSKSEILFLLLLRR